MIGMGIDASTTCCGWCIFDDDKLIDFGKIKPHISIPIVAEYAR